MSASQKEWLSRWLPLVVAVGANLVTIAYGYGKLEQRVAPLENHANAVSYEKLHGQFVTRGEISELRTDIRELNAKVDRLLERSRE